MTRFRPLARLVQLAGLGSIALVLIACGGRHDPAEHAIAQWRAGDIEVELVPVEAAADVASLRLILPTGKLYEDGGGCGKAHLAEHLIGRTIALHDRALAGYGYRVDGFTGPDRIVISLDVGGGAAGVAAATRALADAVAAPAAAAGDLSYERRFVALEDAEGTPLALPDSPAAFLSSEQRATLLGDCPAPSPMTAAPLLPALTGEAKLLVLSAMGEEILRSAIAPIALPRAAPGPVSPKWRSERWTEVASDQLPPGRMVLTALTVDEAKVTPDKFLGHMLFWSLVRSEIPGARLATPWFADGALFARLDMPATRMSESSLRQRAQAIADGAVDPAALSRAVQETRDEICRRRGERRSAPLPTRARLLALDGAAMIEERLVSTGCDAPELGRNAQSLARDAASAFLAHGLATLVSARAHLPQPGSPEPLTLHICASGAAPDAALEVAAMTVQRQLGYRLRFQDGIARRLRAAPKLAAGGSCLVLLIDGEAADRAATRLAVERWFAQSNARDYARQFCFDARVGAGGARRDRLADFAALAPDECAAEYDRLHLDRLLPAMKLEP